MIHKLADVQSDVIGNNTNIWQYCVVMKTAVIGNDCNINSHVLIENGVVLGNRVTVKSGVQLWQGIKVDDDVFIGPNATFTNDKYPRSKKYPSSWQTIHIKQGASIGANCTVTGGLTVGVFSMLGAGSVLTRNIPAHELWYGNPAKFRAYICKCGNKLSTNLICNECNIGYELNNQGICQKK